MNGCSNCSKHRDIRKECPWGGTYHHKAESGEHIGICNVYEHETNADHIRSLNDEELANLLCINGWRLWETSECLDWLRQPWEEDA